MLTEHFIAAIGAPSKAPSSGVAKDASIFLHEHQPLAAQRAVFKKSATALNCLAVSRTHVFAAQTEKAVVHVYSRERGNQEATVPFVERITCLTLACEDSVLVLGTNEGRIFLWELVTGRQVTTSQAHLQTVTTLAVDAGSNFLISGSADSTCHVWSIPALLSFTNATAQPLGPLRTFANQRAEINALAIGHGQSFQNIAITAAQDKTCLVWDYHTNAVLRTYLLLSIPTSVALDPADRAFYVGYDNGSVQRIDFFAADKAGLGGLHNASDAMTPIQPKRSLWTPSDKETGSVMSLDVSFDGTTVLSGHQSGAIFAWDVATSHVKSALPQGPLPGPVTNLKFLPVSGFRAGASKRLGIEAVIKPKFGAFQEDEADTVPGSYALNVHLPDGLKTSDELSAFEQALYAPSFSADLLDEGLGELAMFGQVPHQAPHQAPHQVPHAATIAEPTEQSDDFMALDEPASKDGDSHLREENAELKAQLAALRRVQGVTFDKIESLQAERQALLQREKKRALHKAHSSVEANGVSHEESNTSDENMTSSSDEN